MSMKFSEIYFGTNCPELQLISLDSDDYPACCEKLFDYGGIGRRREYFQYLNSSYFSWLSHGNNYVIRMAVSGR